MKDSSDESSSSGKDETDDEKGDSESEGEEPQVTEDQVEGFRLIDVAILNQNIASQLACQILLSWCAVDRGEVSRIRY